MTHLKLLVISDDNELTFVKVTGKDKALEYVYSKSITKLGTTLTISQDDVDKKISNNIFKTL